MNSRQLSNTDDHRARATRMVRLARYLWAAPCSLLGLLIGFALVCTGGRCARVEGVLEVALSPGDRLPWTQRLPFTAITLGHVIIGTDAGELAALRAHEHVHVRQYERWGIALLIAYPLSSLVQLLRGRDPYRCNRFEIEAYASSSRV